MPGSKLGAHRVKIDALDDKILKLLEARAQLAQQVGEEKRRRGDKHFSVPEREAQILRRLKKDSALLKPHIAAIYREIISACLACEKPVRAAYLGPAGTYTHEAALKYFGRAAELSAEDAIENALNAAEKEQSDYAIVPFENSSAGTVGVTMDALATTPLNITGEIVMRIRHNLLAADGALNIADIRHIYAHQQASEQCWQWLQEKAPKAALTFYPSNAAAALAAAKKGGATAAIGSLAAKEIYGLAPLATDIEDSSHNSTRFLILGKQQPAPSGADKTSFIMTVKDEAGAMLNVLKPFSDSNVNMIKLESRPVRDRLWEYLFFVDIIGHQTEKPVAAALAAAKKRAADMKILGSYPRG